MAEGANGCRLEWGFWYKYRDMRPNHDVPTSGFDTQPDNLQSPWPCFESFLRRVAMELMVRVTIFPGGRLTHFQTKNWVDQLKCFWLSWGKVTHKVAISRRPQHPELLQQWCNLPRLHNSSLNSTDFMSAQDSELSKAIRMAMRTWGGFPRIPKHLLLRFIGGDMGVNNGNPPDTMGVMVPINDRLKKLKLDLKAQLQNTRTVSSHAIRGNLDAYISQLDGEYAFGVPLSIESAKLVFPQILALLAFETLAVSRLAFTAELVSPDGAELVGTQVSCILHVHALQFYSP